MKNNLRIRLVVPNKTQPNTPPSKKEPFAEKIMLLLADKLLIGIIILIAAWYLNLRLEDHKNSLTKMKDKADRKFQLYYDSISRVYEDNRRRDEQLYLEERNSLEKREDQGHQLRMRQIDNTFNVELERIKDQMSFDSYLNKELVVKVSDAWRFVYSSEAKSDSIIEIIDEMRGEIRTLTEALNNHRKENGEIPIPQLGTQLGRVSTHSFQYVVHLYCDTIIFQSENDRIQMLSTEIDKEFSLLNREISKGISFVNQNRFWLGAESSAKLLEFLKYYSRSTNDSYYKDYSNGDFAPSGTFDLSFDASFTSLVEERTRKKEDIYSYRDLMFKNSGAPPLK
jgi:hypothetical protein